MRTLEIKIDSYGLRALCDYIEFPRIEHLPSPEQKALACIMDGVMNKLRKKAIDKEDSTKAFKMKFKYHEAYALEKACRMVFASQTGSTYIDNVFLTVANQINKEL